VEKTKKFDNILSVDFNQEVSLEAAIL